MMHFRNLAFVVAFGLGSASLAVAQETRSETMHLIVAASVPDGTVMPGKRISLEFDVTPKRNMHVYAPGKHDYQVIGITLDPQPWMRIQPTKYPPSEIHDFPELNEKVEVYSKPFKLVQELTVLRTPAVEKQLAAATSLPVTGLLTYQACDEKVCYAPAKVAVKFLLKVRPLVRPSRGQ